jgi:hypothetical protein
MKRFLTLLALSMVFALQASAQVSITDNGDRLTIFEASVQKAEFPKADISRVKLLNSTTIKIERQGVFGRDYAFSTTNVDTAAFVADSSFSFTYPNLTTPAEIRLWILVSAGLLQK